MIGTILILAAAIFLVLLYFRVTLDPHWKLINKNRKKL